MNNNLKGPIILSTIGAAGIILWIMIKPLLLDTTQNETSDASNVSTTVTIAIDDWVGYVPLCSKYNIKKLRQQGIGIKCINDNADYTDRMSKLKSNEIDLAVAEVGSYIIEGENANYPGVIVAVLDTSNGGDAIVVNTSVYPSMDTLKDDTNARYAMVTKSPSEFFALTTGLHFGIEYMLKDDQWKVAQDSPEAVLNQLTSGAVDVAVLWEPNVTKALHSGQFKKLVSTADAENIIVDVLLASRTYSLDHPDIINKILITYFKTLKYFKQHPSKLNDEIKSRNSNFADDQIQDMQRGVHLINLTENCRVWFGCDDADWQSEIGVIDTVEMAVDTWVTYGVFDDNPLPDEDPYRLVATKYLKHLYSKGIDTIDSTVNIGNPLERSFEHLTSDQWANLTPFGKMKTQPILFRPGTNVLRIEGKEVLDTIVSNLKHYPSFRLKIDGHTGSRGDNNANIILSQKRADAVKRYLTRTYNIDVNRLLTTGYGGTIPLPLRGRTKFSRAYQSKLARVEISLLTEQY